MHECPVCDAEMDLKEAEELELTTDYENESYYFCCSDCKRTFDKTPAKYTDDDQENPSKKR